MVGSKNLGLLSGYVVFGGLQSIVLKFLGCIILVTAVLKTGECAKTPEHCLDQQELAVKVQDCLDAPLHNISSVGLLSAQQWSSVCKAYHTSMHCIQTLPRACETDGVGGMQLVLQAGLGKLCFDAQALSDFKKHQPCLKEHNDTIKQCEETLIKKSSILLSNIEQHNKRYSEDTMCRIYEDFTNCLKAALEGPCGLETTSLYCTLQQAQVPILIINRCDIRPIEPAALHSRSPPNYHQLTNTFLVLLLFVVHMFIIL